MTPTTLARVAGVLGGLCWLVQAILDGPDGPDSVVNALYWGGLALIALALLGIGAGLVSGLPALRVVVAVCLVVLAWSVVEVLHSQYADATVDGAAGAVLALGCAVGLLRGRRSRTPEPHRSAHSA